jgi:hypothetical protein
MVKRSVAQMVMENPKIDIVAVFSSLLYSKDERVRLDSLKLLIERLEGLPAQSVAMCNPDGTPIGTPLPAPPAVTVTFVHADRTPLPDLKTIPGIQATGPETLPLAID